MFNATNVSAKTRAANTIAAEVKAAEWLAMSRPARKMAMDLEDAGKTSEEAMRIVREMGI